MVSLLLSLTLAAGASASSNTSVPTTRWAAIYDLTQSKIGALTAKGCFHGVYGYGDQDMALVSCGIDGLTHRVDHRHRKGAEGEAFFAELPADQHLCVLECENSEKVADVVRMVQQQAAEHNNTVVFEGRREVVITHSVRGVAPTLCDSVHFGDVDTSPVKQGAFVPTHPFVPQQPMPRDHRAIKRTILRPRGEELQGDETIEKLLADYSQDSVTDYLKDLSTANGDTSGAKVTRNSYSIEFGKGGCVQDTPAWACASDKVNDIQNILNDLFKDYPGEWDIERFTFRADMCDNIILKMGGEAPGPEAEHIVISSAHLDSRNTGSGSTASGQAPGADDNGTGSAVLLEMARVIAANKVTFDYTVHFAWFCGEEQGLVGSGQLAARYKQQGDTIIGVFNNDMIGYKSPNYPITLSFMTRSATLYLNQACKEFVAEYVPGLQTGDTAACCSDQQSFYSQGFPAAGIFETPTSSVVYPQYHRTGDSFDNGLINFEQVWQFGRGNFVCMLEFAIPTINNLKEA